MKQASMPIVRSPESGREPEMSRWSWQQRGWQKGRILRDSCKLAGKKRRREKKLHWPNDRNDSMLLSVAKSTIARATQLLQIFHITPRPYSFPSLSCSLSLGCTWHPAFRLFSSILAISLTHMVWSARGIDQKRVVHVGVVPWAPWNFHLVFFTTLQLSLSLSLCLYSIILYRNIK